MRYVKFSAILKLSDYYGIFGSIIASYIYYASTGMSPLQVKFKERMDNFYNGETDVERF